MESVSKPQLNSSLGLFGIFRESIKTISRNGKLLVPIILFMFLSMSQLDLVETYIIAPLDDYLGLHLANHPYMGHDLSHNNEQSPNPGAVDEILKILLEKLIFLTFSSIITYVFFVCTVLSSYEAYTAKVLGPKELLSKIRTSWKKPLVTSFYMILITLGIACFAFLSSFIASISKEHIWLSLFFEAITLFIQVSYLYVAALWLVSVIVSVLEEGFDGVKAIGRATDLISGKRIQAFMMMVLFIIAYGVIGLVDDALASYDLSKSTKLAIMIPLIEGSECLVMLFMFVVYTVFYHERKIGHDEKEIKDLYLPIAAGEA